MQTLARAVLVIFIDSPPSLNCGPDRCRVVGSLRPLPLAYRSTSVCPPPFGIVMWLSIPISRSTPKTTVLVGRRLGGSARTRSHHLICAAHQTSKMALDGLFSWFASRQAGQSGR